MSEHPILFSGPMVKEILEGRKTQTRRVIRDARGAFWDHAGWSPVVTDGYLCAWKTTDGKHTTEAGSPQRRCPYGQPGDLLYVKETYNPGLCPGNDRRDGYRGCVYKADDERAIYAGGWTSARFMFRRHSRLTLCITDVRVQRVQEITEEDAKAEGDKNPFEGHLHHDGTPIESSSVLRFKGLWDSINVKRGYGWDSNPWVFAITFERVSRDDARG